jgi:hypothetical protein
MFPLMYLYGINLIQSFEKQTKQPDKDMGNKDDQGLSWDVERNPKHE